MNELNFNIVHPTGADAPNFEDQELCDEIGIWLAIPTRGHLNDEDQPDGLRDDDEFNDDLDDKRCLEELEKKVRQSGERRYFPRLENSMALRVIMGCLMKRNTTQHNNLNRIESQLQNFLSAALILMGPAMVNCPYTYKKIEVVLEAKKIDPVALLDLPVYM